MLPQRKLNLSEEMKSLKLTGAPEKIRTPNLLIRSQMLYPIELRALKMKILDNYRIQHRHSSKK